MATPRQWRRRRRFSLFALTVAAALVVAAVAFGAVTTSQSDYSPGSLVTISGDNSNGAGYVPTNSVDVAVSNTDTGWSDSCSATVADDGNGTWSCTVTLSDDPSIAVGSYTYTATSTAEDGSTISESGTFTDSINYAINTATLTIYAANCSTAQTAFTYGDTVCAHSDVTVTANGSGTPVPATLYVSWYAPGTSPGQSVVPTFQGTQNFTGAGSYDSLKTPSLVGTGTWTVKTCTVTDCFPAEKVKDTKTFTLAKADTTTLSQPSDGSGNLITQAGVGVGFFLQYEVKSGRGVSGNTMHGHVNAAQDDAGLGCDTANHNISASQSTANGSGADNAGFDYNANNTTNASNRVDCMPTTPGTYHVWATFTDNAYNAATDPDGNYNDSSSSPGDQVLVPTTVQVCKAAPAIAADYLKNVLHVKNTSPKYVNTVSLIAGEMADAQQARFPNYNGDGTTLKNGDLLRPCDDGYVQSVQYRTTYLNNHKTEK